MFLPPPLPRRINQKEYSHDPPIRRYRPRVAALRCWAAAAYSGAGYREGIASSWVELCPL